MTDISAFATGHPIMHNNGPTWTFNADGTIVAGQVVAFDATGVSNEVRAAIAEAGERPVGVALTGAADGEKVTVAMPGAICYVVNADDTTAVDAGHWVGTNDNALGGTVSEITIANGSDIVIGFLLEDLAGGGYALCYIHPQVCTKAGS